MIFEPDIHLRALDRHTQWEIDYAAAGDRRSALDACLDALALAAELSLADDAAEGCPRTLARRSPSRPWRPSSRDGQPTHRPEQPS
jgi:hypothetical protein